MLSELALALTGEPLPYATLMYVWARTARRKAWSSTRAPTASASWCWSPGPRAWAAGSTTSATSAPTMKKPSVEAPGALVGIAIMTDSDNTRNKAKAWYGPSAW